MLRSFQYRALQASFVMARKAGAKASLVYVPDEITPPDPLKFNSTEMLALFEVGRQAGLGRDRWLNAPPHLERFSH